MFVSRISRATPTISNMAAIIRDISELVSRSVPSTYQTPQKQMKPRSNVQPATISCPSVISQTIASPLRLCSLQLFVVLFVQVVGKAVIFAESSPHHVHPMNRTIDPAKPFPHHADLHHDLVDASEERDDNRQERDKETAERDDVPECDIRLERHFVGPISRTTCATIRTEPAVKFPPTAVRTTFCAAL